jgi:hypothetical protein
MSDKSVFINLFNQKAEEFCKDLVLTFPEVNEFKQLKSGLLLLKNVDVKKPREFFNNYVGINFKQQILSKDESFFLTEVQNHVQVGMENAQWQTVIALLRRLWATLNDDNKESIWKYFQVLVAINDKCA